MKKIARIALSAAATIVLVSGCASSAYQRALEEARRKMEEQKKLPLPPLPAYSETGTRYATSARVMVVGGETERKLLSDALKAAGYAVTEQRDVQSADFRRPDFILWPSLDPQTEYGDGSIWTRVRLIVSVRRPVTLGKDGRPLPSAPPKVFQAFARAANPRGVRVLTTEERRSQTEMLASCKQYLNQENYDRVKEQIETSFKESDEQAAKAANVAVANMLRNAPFREFLATP